MGWVGMGWDGMGLDGMGWDGMGTCGILCGTGSHVLWDLAWAGSDQGATYPPGWRYFMVVFGAICCYMVVYSDVLFFF